MSATEKRNTVDTVAWNKQINWKLLMEMLERVFQFLAQKDLKTALKPLNGRPMEFNKNIP